MWLSQDFPSRLKAARKTAKITQVEIAKFLGIAKDTYSRYERGEVTPSLDVFIKIVVFFMGTEDEIDANWLLFGDLERINKPNPITIKHFGYLPRLFFGTGFDRGYRGSDGAYAEIVFNNLDVAGVLKQLRDLEIDKDNPDNKLIECLSYCSEALHEDDMFNHFVGQVDIAKHAVRLEPLIPYSSAEEIIDDLKDYPDKK